MRLPAKVTIVEAGPRDGLQNEATHVSSEDKVRLIDALAERKSTASSTLAATARSRPFRFGTRAE